MYPIRITLLLTLLHNLHNILHILLLFHRFDKILISLSRRDTPIHIPAALPMHFIPTTITCNRRFSLRAQVVITTTMVGPQESHEGTSTVTEVGICTTIA
jgi:hypothetical protein